MKIAVFNARTYDTEFLDRANAQGLHELSFFESALNAKTAPLAEGCRAVCIFVNDEADADVLEALHRQGVELVLLRCSGFNHVDLSRADALGIRVGRVPAYSPHAVAEHAVGLILALNRKIYRAYARVREGNFALDGLLGFDLYG
jgi:D-lactate dehydrogenase